MLYTGGLCFKPSCGNWNLKFKFENLLELEVHKYIQLNLSVPNHAHFLSLFSLLS